ncbi:MAG: glycosyltransferase family 4 protein [Chitinophagaceae bacterium]
MSQSQNAGKTIALVSNNCWSLFNFRIQVIRHFLNRGFRVIAIAGKDEFLQDLMELGCEYHEVSFKNSSVAPLSDLKVYLQLKKIYAREKPDMIFHYVTKPSIYGSIIAGKLNIPSIAIITGLGYVYASNSWLTIPVSFLFRKALANASEVWFLNRENAGYFTGRKILLSGRSRILPGEGIDTQYFYPSKNKEGNKPFVFLMVSRLLWSKGVGIYMQAAAIVKSKGYHAVFQFQGRPESGHPESILAADLNNWEEKGLMQNLGFSKDVRKSLSVADCFVLPTYYEEGIPRSIMEACSMEIPVITTDQTGCNSIIEDRIHGLLCKPRDPHDLAEKMIAMMQLSISERNQMGKLGREKMITQFDISLILKNYDEAIIRYMR